MSAWQIWKRLLWKELREGWLALMVANLLPAVLFPAAALCPRDSDHREYLVFLVAIGPLLVVALYAGRKAEGKGRTNELAVVLPGKRAATWVTSLIIPLAFTALAGIVYGALNNVLIFHDIFNSRGPETAYKLLYSRLSLNIVLGWSLVFAACFSACYLLSSAVSIWAALAGGVIGAVCGVGLLNGMTGSADGPMNSFLDLTRDMSGFLNYGLAIVAACAIGSLIFMLLANRSSLRVRQMTSMGVTAGLILMVVTPKLFVSLRHSSDETWRNYPSERSSPDGSLTVSMSDGHKARRGEIWLSCRDYRRGMSFEKAFRPPVRVLFAKDVEHVYLAHRLEDRHSFQVFMWNAAEDRVSSAATVRRSSGPPNDPWEPESSLSPDGHYLLALFGSGLGIGWDLWLIDLRMGKGKMIAANSLYQLNDVIWTRKSAVFCWQGKLLTIDLRSMKGRCRSLESEGRSI
ncbi:MAG: hypothetical protein Q7T82_03220 [Armatimonadota bacterium]|nr:hypothetical protein [Armatimonadota bacterium]